MSSNWCGGRSELGGGVDKDDVRRDSHFDESTATNMCAFSFHPHCVIRVSQNEWLVLESKRESVSRYRLKVKLVMTDLYSLTVDDAL